MSSGRNECCRGVAVISPVILSYDTTGDGLRVDRMHLVRHSSRAGMSWSGSPVGLGNVAVIMRMDILKGLLTACGEIGDGIGLIKAVKNCSRTP
jgi:hypothetical protein